jgi:flavin-binding protein dodecin
MTDHVYKHIELTGSSAKSSDDAIRNALAKAAKTIHNIRWFQVVETRGHVDGGAIAHWQVTIKVGFSLDD